MIFGLLSCQYIKRTRANYQFAFVYLLKEHKDNSSSSATTPPPSPGQVPRTPSDEETSQSVKLVIQGLNVSQVGNISFSSDVK